MKPNRTRELLITTKAAQNWNDDFDQRVDELMCIVNKVDNEKQVQQVSETLDVYQNSTHKSKSKRKKIIQNDRPFEFLVFRN